MPGNTDAYLWYNVGQWQDYGLAVPNWSDDNKSQNNAIRDLVQVIGRNLSAVMWHTDARLSTPPSINTLQRIHRQPMRYQNAAEQKGDAGSATAETASYSRDQDV